MEEQGRPFNYIKSKDDIYEHLISVHLHGGARINDGRLDEPGQAQAEQDVENIAAYCVAHRHVA
jgi:hypothetical protein